MLIEIAVKGYDHGNPHSGFVAFAIWIDGHLLREESILLTGITPGSNRLSPSYAQTIAINCIKTKLLLKSYNVIFYGNGEVDPVSIVSLHYASMPNKFYKYFQLSKRHADFIYEALEIKKIQTYGDSFPSHVSDFMERHKEWIHLKDTRLAPGKVHKIWVYGQLEVE